MVQSVEIAMDEGHFGLFDNQWNIPFEVTRTVSTHALATLPAIAIGLLCGTMGALFTVINLKVRACNLLNSFATPVV